MWSSPMPTSPFFSAGDLLGAESGADLMLVPGLLERPYEDDDAPGTAERRMALRRSHRWEMKEKMKEKEYPPPIPLLARTENLHSHMPWVLQRTYTSDGRLILSEEPVKHHEYFRADRKDGRLTLELVPLVDDVDLVEEQADPETDHMPQPDYNGGIDIDDDDDQLRCSGIDNGLAEDRTKLADEVEPSTSPKIDVGGGIGKCLNVYNMSGGSGGGGGGGSSCIFGVPVPALRPVHG